MRKNKQNKTIRISVLALKLINKCKPNPNEPHWQTIEKIATEYLVNNEGKI